MKYALLSGALFLFICSPALADGPTCYVCSQSQCFESSLAGFAAASCESRCFFLGGGPICLCRTFGPTCIRSPDDTLVDPLHPEYAYSMAPGLHQELTGHLPAEVGLLFDQSVADAYLGVTRGSAAAENEDGKRLHLFTFEGKIELTPDGIYQHFALTDHPELSEVEVTIYDSGRRALLVKTGHTGKTEAVEVFSE